MVEAGRELLHRLGEVEPDWKEAFKALLEEGIPKGVGCGLTVRGEEVDRLPNLPGDEVDDQRINIRW